MTFNSDNRFNQSESWQTFKEAKSVLHTFLLAPVILFQMDAGIFMAFFNSSFQNSLTARLIFLALVPLNIFLWAATLGVLCDLASEETFLISFKRFMANGRRYSRDVVIVSMTLLVLHFLLFVVIPYADISFDVLSTCMSLVGLGWLAWRMILDKFIIPMKLSARSFRVGLTEFFILLGFMAAYAVLLIASRFINIPLPWLDAARFLLLFSRYLMCLSFVYIVGLILNGYPEIRRKFTFTNEIFLINPPGPGLFEGVASLFLRLHPGVFVVLRALTPTTYHIREFSRILWRDRYYHSGKLVCITCFTSNCSEAYKIAKEFRRRGSKVILGGPHVTYLPEEALEFCDSVVTGEAEGIWEEVIRDYEAGTLKSRYAGQARDDYHERVHNQLMASEPSIIKDFLETTRGCKFKCHFCTIPGLSSGRTRQKPSFELVELLEKVKTHHRHVNFIDNNIYSDPGYARELFKELKPLKMTWGTQCTIDIAKNEETLHLARESGCTDFLIGYEIAGSSVEHAQGGKFALADNYLKFSETIKKKGIGIKAHFIFGYDSDNFRSLWKLWKFCFKLRPKMTIVSLLTPLPGSALYEQIAKENRLTNLNWRRYSCHVLVYRQKGMNNFVLAKLYPVFYVFFLLTTSSFGNFLLVFCAVAFFLLNRINF